MQEKERIKERKKIIKKLMYTRSFKSYTDQSKLSLKYRIVGASKVQVINTGTKSFGYDKRAIVPFKIISKASYKFLMKHT